MWRARRPHPQPHLSSALILSAHQSRGRMPACPLPGSCCQPENPTHLGSKVLPANCVLGAMGVIPVPPMQVQLCGTVAGREALEVHGWGQLQLHCREWRGNLQSQVDNTCPGPRQGAGGCSKVGTRENTVCRPEIWPLSLGISLFH